MAVRTARWLTVENQGIVKKTKKILRRKKIYQWKMLVPKANHKIKDII